MTSAVARHAVLGLVIETNRPLPGLPLDVSTRPVDVIVHLRPGREGESLGADKGCERPWYETAERDGLGRPLLAVTKSERSCRFRYAEGAAFDVRLDGASIEGVFHDPLTLADAASFVLGPILGFVLRLRGVVPLHASAAVVDGRAVLFCGPAGAGKSSTAAAMGVNGLPVLSDDVVPLSIHGGRVCADPGFPRVSIWDDTAQVILGNAEHGLQAWSDTYAKRCLGPDLVPFAVGRTEVAAVYVLEARAADVATRALTPREALMALVANTFGNYLMDPAMRRHELDMLANVVQRVPVRALQWCTDLDGLRAACRSLVGIG